MSDLAQKSNPEAQSKNSPEKLWAYVFLAFGLLLSLIVRLRLQALPLERDEGEYAFFGQQILGGVAPFAEAGNMKLPGVYYCYAVLMGMFGQSASGVHLGLLVVNLTTIVLLFFIGKKMFGWLAGGIAAAAFSVLCLVPQAYGLAGHATHFVALFACAGLLMLLTYFDKRKIVFAFISGLLFGLSFLMKQHALFFILFGLVALFFDRKNKEKSIQSLSKAIAVYLIGAAIPYLLLILTTITNGTFDKFWHWTFEYASQYANIKTFADGWKFFSMNLGFITTGAWLIWLAAAVGLFWKNRERQPSQVILGLFFTASFLSICPGWYFRNHYFIALFPAVALAAGLFFQSLSTQFESSEKSVLKISSPILAVLPLIFTVSWHFKVLFSQTPDQVCSQIYGRNPFRESVEVAKFVQQYTRAGERIVVFGSEPQIYFYANRKPATSFIYTYPLLENQPYSAEMQAQMRSEIEAAKPRFIIFVNGALSWLPSAQSDQTILQWFENYSSQFYAPVGLVDLIAPGNAKYLWRTAVPFYRPQNPANLITVFERK